MVRPARPLAQALVLYALPLAGSQLISLFGSTASKALLQHLVDTKALATSALPLPWVGFCVAIVAGLCYGTLMMLARERDTSPAAAHRLSGEALCAVAVFGAILACTGVLLAPQILALQATPHKLLATGIPYVRIEAVILPFTFLYMMYGTIREGAGDSRTPFFMLLAYVILYVALMPPLMLGMGIFPRLGTLAAPIAQLIATVAVVAATAFAFRIPFRVTGKASLADMLTMDIPISVQYAGVAAADLLIFRFANLQGIASVATYTAMLTIIAYIAAPAAVLSTAAAFFAGSALGDARLADARQVLRLTFVAGCACSIAVAAAIYAFAPGLLATMLAASHAFTLGLHALYSCAWSVPLLNAGTLLCAVMRAGKQTVAPMVTTLAGVWLVQIPATWWLSAHGDAMAIWKAYACAYAVIGGLQCAYFGALWMRKNMGAVDAAPMPA